MTNCLGISEASLDWLAWLIVTGTLIGAGSLIYMVVQLALALRVRKWPATPAQRAVSLLLLFWVAGSVWISLMEGLSAWACQR